MNSPKLGQAPCTFPICDCTHIPGNLGRYVCKRERPENADENRLGPMLKQPENEQQFSPEQFSAEAELAMRRKFTMGRIEITPTLTPQQEIVSVVERFSDAMGKKLVAKASTKTGWKDMPVEALFKMLMIEIEEFKVAHEFFNVDTARKELVDVANYALILWDRLGVLEQGRNYDKQQREVRKKAD